MKDKVIKAHLKAFDENLRIPHTEKETIINELTVKASVYKNTSSNTFYCIAVIISNGEYLFEEGAGYSRYYSEEEVRSRDIAQETIVAIKQQILFRKRLLTFISNNPNLPSILNAAYNRTLLVYYAKEGKLRIAKLNKNELVINLPAKEQVYLTELLEEFSIKVRRVAEEAPFRYELT